MDKNKIIEEMVKAKGGDQEVSIDVETDEFGVEVEEEDEFNEFTFDDDEDFEEEEEDSNPDEEEEEEDSEEDSEEESDETETPEHHKFTEMRVAQKRAEEEAQRNKEQLEFIARSQGFESAEAFLDAFKQKQLEDEAKAKGVDPEIYTRMKKLEDENKAIREEAEKEKSNAHLNRFLSAVDEVSNSLGFDDAQKNELINKMGEDGYSAEDLIKIKNPRRFIEGYSMDLDSYKESLKEKAIQDYIASKEKASKSSEPKIKGSTDGKLSMQDIIAMKLKEMNS